MEVTHLSTNGFHLTNIFDSALLGELNTFNCDFIPTRVQSAGDFQRDVCLVQGNIAHKIVDVLKPLIKSLTPDFGAIGGIEMWRDYPGYNNPYHYDAPNAQNVMIVYLDDAYSGMGTGYVEDNNSYQVDFKKNSGIIVLNSDTIEHGMIGSVPDNVVRRTLYINWVTTKRHEELNGR